MTTTKTARKPLSTLIIDQFEVPVNLAENFACGGVEGEFTILGMDLSTRGLTAEGFVTEVNGFKDLILKAFAGRDDRYLSASCASPENPMFKGSCEELAGAVVHLAHRAVGDARLERVTVEIMNLTGSVSLTWERGDEVPSFLREATDAERRATLASYGQVGDDRDGRREERDDYGHAPRRDLRAYGHAPRRNVC